MKWDRIDSWNEIKSKAETLLQGSAADNARGERKDALPIQGGRYARGTLRLGNETSLRRSHQQR